MHHIFSLVVIDAKDIAFKLIFRKDAITEDIFEIIIICNMIKLRGNQSKRRKALLTINDKHLPLHFIGDKDIEIIPVILFQHLLRHLLILMFFIRDFEGIEDIVQEDLHRILGPYIFTLIKINVIHFLFQASKYTLLIRNYFLCHIV